MKLAFSHSPALKVPAMLIKGIVILLLAFGVIGQGAAAYREAAAKK